MEQWAAATRKKKSCRNRRWNGGSGQSGLQILDKTRARIWDSSVVYYCLGKPEMSDRRGWDMKRTKLWRPLSECDCDVAAADRAEGVFVYDALGRTVF